MAGSECGWLVRAVRARPSAVRAVRGSADTSETSSLHSSAAAVESGQLFLLLSLKQMAMTATATERKKRSRLCRCFESPPPKAEKKRVILLGNNDDRASARAVNYQLSLSIVGTWMASLAVQRWSLILRLIRGKCFDK